MKSLKSPEVKSAGRIDHTFRLSGLGDGPVAQLTNTAVLKATSKTVAFQNVWLFEVASGRLVSAQLYADTAAVRSGAG